MRSIRRRELLKATTLGLVGAAMGSQAQAQAVNPKAKKLLYLYQQGAPSQLEFLDYKPLLAGLRNELLPDSVLNGQRITTLTAGQGGLRIASPLVSFAQYGQSGIWFSELMPHMATFADDFCLIKSMHTDAINHEPADNLWLTGNQLPGKPSIGAWVSYGLGTLNPNLPSFVVLQSETTGIGTVQPIAKRLWGSAFLPATHQGVALRAGNTPIFYLEDDLRLGEAPRKQLFDAVQQMNTLHFDKVGNPDILRRNDSYAMASVLQGSMADVADESDEPQSTYDAYGPDARTPGSYAANCLRARRLLERDVRVVMLAHRGWDAHSDCTKECGMLAAATDQPTAALLKELKERGLLEETLVVWGGEFGRSVFSHGPITETDHGRDHHAYAFPTLLAGAGVQKGLVYGETDDFSFNVVDKPVHVHDLQATILKIMGLDQFTLTVQHDGRTQRLTDLGGSIVNDILS